MFQLAIHAFEPFKLYEFLGATMFLTTGKTTYPDLERLSADQMERRLNSRSLGLLEAAREKIPLGVINVDDDEPVSIDEKARVQFIHQTVKEFMMTGEGYLVIREGVAEYLQHSGIVLLFQYLMGILVHFVPDQADFDASQFLICNFTRYAQRCELREHQRAADYLSPTLSRITEQERHNFLTRVIDEAWPPKCANLLSYLRGQPGIQLLLFYILCGLPDSVRSQAETITTELTNEEIAHLFSAATELDSVRGEEFKSYSMKEVLLSCELQTRLDRRDLRTAERAPDACFNDFSHEKDAKAGDIHVV